MALNLSSILEKFARPIDSALNFVHPHPTDEQRAAMDEYAAVGEPLTAGGRLLKQSTPQTCGAMVMLVARAYLLPNTRREIEENPDFIEAIENELYASLRERALGLFDYPQKYGTPPWMLAKRLTELRPDLSYRFTPVDDSTDHGWSALQWAAHATSAGIPVPLYTGNELGSGISGAVPRHVVLAIPGANMTPDGIPQVSIYDPGSGLVHEVPLPALVDRTQNMPALGNWTKIVGAVLPDRTKN